VFSWILSLVFKIILRIFQEYLVHFKIRNTCTVKNFHVKSLATVCSVVLTVNSQRNSIKSQTKPINICIFIGFVCDFIDFFCEFTVKTAKPINICIFIGFVCDFIVTVKTTEHTVASYESSENFLTVWNLLQNAHLKEYSDP
jgi:hypothetical protein